MAIANVTLNNTFEQWRGITNQLTVAVNEFESNGNLIRIVSNTSSIVPTANVGRGHIIHIGVDLSNDTSNTGLTIIPSAQAVNSVMSLAVSNFEVTNAVFTQSNTDNIRLSAAYVVTNAAFRQSNTDNVRLTEAYTVLNAAYTSANANFVVTNSVFGQSNTDNIRLSAAYVVVNSAFTQSNTDNIRLTAAFTQSNTDNIRLTSAYVSTNAAFVRANNAHGRIDLLDANASTLTLIFQNSYDVINAAFTQSNTDNVRLTAAYDSLNVSFVVANSAFETANDALDQISFLTGNGITQVQAFQSSYDNSNGAFRVANSGFDRVNTVFTFSNTVYAAVNTLSVSSNAGFVVANAAFGSANSIAIAANNYAGAMSNASNAWTTATFLPRTGGSITGSLSISSGLTIAGDLTVSGTTTYTNTQTVLVGDNILTLNADVPPTVAPSENAGIEVDRGNAPFTALLWNETTDRWTFTNDGTTYDNMAGVTTDINPINTRLSSAYVHANAAFTFANGVSSTLTGETTRLSAAYVHANSAYTFANGVSSTLTSQTTRLSAAYVHANAAFNRANTGLTSVSGSAGRITSSGGLTPTIDLATGGVGAGTYGGSGVQSITVDAYGRVTGVAAPAAAYLTTSSYVGFSAFSGLVSGARFASGYDSGAASSFSCSNWFRSNGSTGWYNDTFGGGIMMQDTSWVRVANGKAFWASGTIQSDSDVRTPIFYDTNNTGFYFDPNSTSNVNRINMNYLYIYNGTAVTAELVGGWGAYGTVTQLRTDNNGSGTQDGPRIWYHKQGAKSWSAGVEAGGSNGWGVWEDGSNGGWGSLRFVVAAGGSTISTVSFQTPIMYDYNNTGYYVDGNGTSRLNIINADLLRSYGGAYADIYYDNGDTNFYVRPRSVSIMNDVRASIFYDRDNTGFYTNPASGTRLGGTTHCDYIYSGGDIRAAGWIYAVGRVVVGEGQTSSMIEMRDTDESTRFIHNNSGTIGFLNNTASWRFRVADDGNVMMGTYQDWLSNQIRSGIFYDNDTGYYFDGNSTSSLNVVHSNNHYIRPGAMLFSDHGGWSGDANKIQWHSSHLYLQNTAGGRLLVLRRGDGGEPFAVDYSGNATCRSLYASDNVTAFSDVRLKENIVTINNPLDIIRKLRGVTFDWIESKKHSYGLIAQEVEKVVPELVEEVDASHSMDEDPNMIKTVDYSKMVSILIEGMKAQQDQIEQLKTEISKLKGE